MSERKSAEERANLLEVQWLGLATQLDDWYSNPCPACCLGIEPCEKVDSCASKPEREQAIATWIKTWVGDFITPDAERAARAAAFEEAENIAWLYARGLKEPSGTCGIGDDIATAIRALAAKEVDGDA